MIANESRWTEFDRQRLQVARCQLVKLASCVGGAESKALREAVALLDGAIPPTDQELLARMTGTSP